ncbi:MAG TPA: alpha-amylase family glycosyl hydrolase, partial [Lacipirellulaceae bacterium]|nr:alpha-amylase family glycosyl hydrolase [Lacipirellulaceae bacterium]
MIAERAKIAQLPGYSAHRWCSAVLAGLLLSVAVGCDKPGAAREPAREPAEVPLVTRTEAPPPRSGRNFDAGARLPSAALDVDQSSALVPDWAADAIFYQIFPERFCNGDRSNDPTRESLEFPEQVPKSWKISPWTGDWYARADWEKESGPNFYDNGVFNRRYGGDLEGVIEKLDYLSTLGINTIYLNPVFYARSLHKYDGSSFHHIDPCFGPDPAGDLKMMAVETSDPASWKWTSADKLFLDLLQKAHARKIRVIIDGVFNHTGRDFFAFADLRTRQAKSPYRDWYIVQSYDDPATPQNEFRYKGWWGVDTLPEFAHKAANDDLQPGPKQYILNITKRWMDPNRDGDPSDGIDGWRLDVANEVPTGFW